MKKRCWKFALSLAVLVALLALCTIAATAQLYSPSYYGVEKVKSGTIIVDGAVDEAYGEPIFFYQADGMDDPGDYTSSGNWFFTKDMSGNIEDVLALILVNENYAKGYARWTDDALYLCVDANILGWNQSNELTAQRMWQAFCLQLFYQVY